MEDNTFKDLSVGDIIKHENDNETYIVTANYGTHIIAVNTIHVSNPAEWNLVMKANYSRPSTGRNRQIGPLKG